MAFQRVPFTYQVNVEFNHNGSFGLNTFYARVDEGDYGAAAAAQLAEGVADWCTATWVSALGAATSIEQVTVRGLNAAADVLEVSTTGLPEVGSYTSSEPLPSNVAFAMTRRTGLTGRSQRGRIYIPLCLAMLATNENYVNPTWEAVARGALNLLSDAMQSYVSSAVEVIVSRYSGGAARAEAVTYAVNTYSPADLTIDTQRRRLP